MMVSAVNDRLLREGLWEDRASRCRTRSSGPDGLQQAA